MSRILIVEDEVAIADLEKDYLSFPVFRWRLKIPGRAGADDRLRKILI